MANSANAYIFEMEYERLRQESDASAKRLEAKREAVEQARIAYEENQSKKIERKAKIHVKLFVNIVIAFAVCFFLINRYVAVYETSNQVASAKREYEVTKQLSDKLKEKIDKVTDIKTLEQIAGERLGMSRPESYQIFYVDMKMKNYGEKVKAVPRTQNEVPVSGVAGIIIRTIMGN